LEQQDQVRVDFFLAVVAEQQKTEIMLQVEQVAEDKVVQDQVVQEMVEQAQPTLAAVVEVAVEAQEQVEITKEVQVVQVS
jgi:tetrahydromethanopterin S-methyltransferase subunit B|tara:strand:- start:121 stop:360 length:240 start_codon:yes stop_codon:yes gene_type:complete